jgi:hypothetical protein
MAKLIFPVKAIPYRTNFVRLEVPSAQRQEMKDGAWLRLVLYKLVLAKAV